MLGLSDHYRAHTSDARCIIGGHGIIASGGRDSLLKLWAEQGGDSALCQEAHPKWVNAVESIPPGHLKMCSHGGFVTGGQDGLLRVYSLDDGKLTLQHTLRAHDAPVCSLSWLNWEGGLLLLSAGWDEVAKVWEIRSAAGNQCQSTTLPGHENNVCVLGCANGDIITGSSGLWDPVADRLIGFQLRVWREAKVVQTIGEEDGGHSAGIRDLTAITSANATGSSAFASASNDGTVGIWAISAQDKRTTSSTRREYTRLLTLTMPSDTFAFSVCYAAPPPPAPRILPAGATDAAENEATTGITGGIDIRGLLFTGDDAGELCMFDLSQAMAGRGNGGTVKADSGTAVSPAQPIQPAQPVQPVQCMKHPNTVWGVTVISTCPVPSSACPVPSGPADRGAGGDGGDRGDGGVDSVPAGGGSDSPATVANRLSYHVDVATACADGSIRLFSTDPTKQLSAELQQEGMCSRAPSPAAAQFVQYESMGAGAGTAGTAGGGALNVATMPLVSERIQYVGSKGTVSLFRDDEEGGNGGTMAQIAFQWAGSDGSSEWTERDDSGGGTGGGGGGGGETAVGVWVRLGAMHAPVPREGSAAAIAAAVPSAPPAPNSHALRNQKQELNGQYFDRILPVEIDSASKGMLSLLLGINEGDDPKALAIGFCKEHGLMAEYIAQIAMFVESSGMS
jgi:hypothetical protein